MLERLVGDGDAHLTTDPWTGVPMVLLPSLNPDVSIIHASQADGNGNVSIEGVTSHEIDMVRASTHTIVTVEEIVPSSVLSSQPERVTISSAFIDGVVHQPFGAFPTSVYMRYDYCEPEIEEYQSISRRSGDAAGTYVADRILKARTFDEFLEGRDPTGQRRRSLEAAMRSLL